VLENGIKGIHLRANRSFVDRFGKERKAGEEWLITRKDCDIYIPDVFESIFAVVKSIILQSNQSATIENYVDETGKQQFGQSKFLKGPHNFFLHPGESCKIGNSRVISPGQILQIRAKEKFNDESGKN